MVQLGRPAGRSCLPGSGALPAHLCKAGGRRRALRCCTLGTAEERNRRLLGTRVRNGTRRDSAAAMRVGR